jgi:hypothetical protein
VTRKAVFLAEIETVVPWSRLVPHMARRSPIRVKIHASLCPTDMA